MCDKAKLWGICLYVTIPIAKSLRTVIGMESAYGQDNSREVVEDMPNPDATLKREQQL